MTKKEKILDKIAKLLAHAESAEGIGSMAEAEAFAAQAHRLMLEHRIDMSDVEYAEFEKEQTVDQQDVKATEFGFKESSRRLTWAEQMAHAVARSHFCRAYGSIGSNRIRFVGATQDREQAVRVFLKLMAARDALGKIEYGRMRKASQETKGFWSGWNKGFSYGVSVRVANEMRKAETELKETNNETGLMRISDAVTKVENFLEKSGVKFVKASQGTNYGSNDAYNRGYNAGRGTDFKTNQLT